MSREQWKSHAAQQKPQLDEQVNPLTAALTWVGRRGSDEGSGVLPVEMLQCAAAPEEGSRAPPVETLQCAAAPNGGSTAPPVETLRSAAAIRPETNAKAEKCQQRNRSHKKTWKYWN